MKPPVAEATCAACMKRKPCTQTFWTTRGSQTVSRYVEIEHDAFFYSKQHRGWICKRCHNRINKELRPGEKGWPDKPGRSP